MEQINCSRMQPVDHFLKRFRFIRLILYVIIQISKTPKDSSVTAVI